MTTEINQLKIDLGILHAARQTMEKYSSGGLHGINFHIDQIKEKIEELSDPHAEAKCLIREWEERRNGMYYDREYSEIIDYVHYLENELAQRLNAGE